MIRQILLAAVVMFCGCGAPIDVSGPERADGRTIVMTAASPPAANEPPVYLQQWYYNEDGSCVPLSIGFNAIRRNNLKAACLPFDCVYGHAIRGGKRPSDIAAIFEERQIAAYNVTGDATKQVIEWAVDTGRGCALGFDRMHFQTVKCRDKKTGLWYVFDNRYPERLFAYDDDNFWAMHESMGFRWCVVLDGPAQPPAPQSIAR